MSSRSPAPGVLSVVATPIGNLRDVTERAADVLRAADVVVAEDTRRTGQLLAHLGIRRPLLSAHRFSEAKRAEGLVARLRRGERLALVTDGGTPGISDPGARLVAAALEAGCRVEPVPGPSALTAALSASGLPADRFLFAGFLPSRPAARRRELVELARYPGTIVFYEAPHRLLAMLEDAASLLGDRPACLCRELTKLHEEIRVGRLRSLRDELAERERILGEIVLVVGPAATAAPAADETDPRQLAAALREALAHEQDDPRRAVARLARRLGADRATIKRRLARLFGA